LESTRLSRPSHGEDPWDVPVPLEPADFTPLHPGHERYAVRVALGRMGPFGFSAPSPEAGPLLHADLQLNADGNAPHRLGSGRAGFHAGRYLKGVGRTQLAANWAEPEDGYHNSGHLFASSAAREYLVSRYLSQRCAGGSIVGCEGLLLAPLPPGGAGYVETLFPGRPLHKLCAADRSLQAITLKGAGFARLSNFGWALAYWGRGARRLADLFYRMAHYLRAPGEPETDASTFTPSALAELLDRALTRATDHFIEFFRAGVYWGSFHNNFTADGRFLDLETPMVFGGPLIGLTAEPGELPDAVELSEHRLFVGFEVLHYLRQFRTFLESTWARLDWLGRNAWLVSDVERRFLEDTAEALRARFPPTHWIQDLRALTGWLTERLSAALHLSPGLVPQLEALADAQARVCLGVEPRRRGMLPLRAIDVVLADPEPTFSVAVAVPRFLEGVVGQTSTGRTFNQALSAVDRAGDLPTALERLREAEAALATSR
jgi:hypothetical protein